MDLEVVSRAERPELGSTIWSAVDPWPEFMNHDPVATALYSVATAQYPALTVVGLRPDGEIVAHGQAIAFRLDHDGRRELPDTGWDQALIWAAEDIRAGVAPDTACALEISVRPDLQGRGLSGRMLAALRAAVAAQGFGTLVAPVRPSDKHLEPATPMADYAVRTRGDGLPHDPWLRTHVRAGGAIERVAPVSMTVAASLARWREWTGLPFDTPGPVMVPAALTPVVCVPEQDHAVYVEPNVWVRHRV